MIFLSLHYGVPAQAQRSGLCGEKEGQRNGADTRRQMGVTEWSLFRRADAEGGLKGPAQLRRSLQGFGADSHQQASAGYIPAHCSPLQQSPLTAFAEDKRLVLLLCPSSPAGTRPRSSHTKRTQHRRRSRRQPAPAPGQSRTSPE